MNIADADGWRRYELLAWRWYGIASVAGFLFWRWWVLVLTIAIFFPCFAAVRLTYRHWVIDKQTKEGERETDNSWLMQ